MFNIYEKGKEILKIISDGAKTAPTLKRIIEIELTEFLGSRKRKIMLEGNAYYVGKHDIKDKTRDGYFADGEKKPNSIIVDNQYKKMVDQKTDFLLGQPITIDTDNERYAELLNGILDSRFQKQMNRLGRNALNNGIAWLYPYIDEAGQLRFRVFPGEQILPFWKDDEHTELDFAVRIYGVEVYEGSKKKIRYFVEVYSAEGIDYFVYEHGQLIEDVEKERRPYFTVVNTDGTEQGYNWDMIPLIAFKYNADELPLIINCKSLQDAINELLSTCQDTMTESSRSTVLILKNYDGENLETFRQNLKQYGVVKVRTVSGIEGGVDNIAVEFKPENHKTVLEMLKKSLIENAMGYDAKDDRLGSNANRMNIQSMYNDINLDAHGMEAEFKESLYKVLYIINAYLYNIGEGDYTGERVKFIFNRDMMMNENEIMTTLLNAGVQISQKTLLSQVPWIDDAQAEYDRVKAEQKESNSEYADLFSGVENEQEER